MAYVDLDKIINIESGGWVVYPSGDDPAPYPVLTQSIGIFNKPDAWDWDSNGWFWLLNNTNNAINAQNNNWNTQMALAVESWVGALSSRIKSFDFSADIKQIDSGQIKYGIFQESVTQNININTVNKTMEFAAKQDIIVNSDIWVATVDWVRYGIVWNKVYTIDSNNKLWTLLTTIEWLSGNDSTGTIKGVVWDKIGILWSSGGYWRMRTVQLLPWWATFTELWKSSGSYPDRAFQWSYQYWDKVYAYFYNTWSSNSSMFVVEYDLITYTSATNYLWHNTQYYGKVSIWFDGTNHYSMWNRSQDFQVWWRWLRNLNTNDFVVWWGDRGNVLYQGDPTKLINRDTNISFKSNDFVNILWTNYQTIGNITIYKILEPTWANIQDDAIVGIILAPNIKFYSDWQSAQLKINWQVVANYSDMLITTDIYSTTLPILQINSPYIEVELSKIGDLWVSQKLALWATWGTYDTPTLPVNNGMSSGDATTPRVPWGDASYINLTLSTN